GRDPIHLTPKEFEILILLLEHPERVVRKEELMARVWPDACVEEGNLTQNISLLRKQLGETADGKAYIETVPKVGYRIGVPVHVCADPAPAIAESARRVVWIVLFLLWSGLCFWMGQKFGANG
ncbi:MAG: transcriptional regulator, partial [Bryobacterales bacterium]|nr:transcriptional regulator [Bryobacterales bacterium]